MARRRPASRCGCCRSRPCPRRPRRSPRPGSHRPARRRRPARSLRLRCSGPGPAEPPRMAHRRSRPPRRPRLLHRRQGWPPRPDRSHRRHPRSSGGRSERRAGWDSARRWPAARAPSGSRARDRACRWRGRPARSRLHPRPHRPRAPPRPHPPRCPSCALRPRRRLPPRRAGWLQRLPRRLTRAPPKADRRGPQPVRSSGPRAAACRERRPQTALTAPTAMTVLASTLRRPTTADPRSWRWQPSPRRVRAPSRRLRPAPAPQTPSGRRLSKPCPRRPRPPRKTVALLQ